MQQSCGSGLRVPGFRSDPRKKNGPDPDPQEKPNPTCLKLHPKDYYYFKYFIINIFLLSSSFGLKHKKIITFLQILKGC